MKTAAFSDTRANSRQIRMVSQAHKILMSHKILISLILIIIIR